MSILLKGGSSGPVIRAKTVIESVSHTMEISRKGVSGGTSDATDGDTVIQTETFSSSEPIFSIKVAVAGITGPFTVENLTPDVVEVISIAGDIVTCRIYDGQEDKVGKIMLKAHDMPSSLVSPLTRKSVSTPPQDRSKSLVSGSLLDAMTVNLLAATEEWEGNEEYYSPASVVGTANPNCWAAAWDLRALAIDTSGGGALGAKGGSLITPRHFVCSRHWSIANGDTLYFEGQSAQVIGRAWSDSPYWTTSDIVVGVLDKDIEAPITPFKVPSSIAGRIVARNSEAVFGYGGIGMAFCQNSRRVYPFLIREDFASPGGLGPYTVDGVDYQDEMRYALFSHMGNDGVELPDSPITTPIWWDGGYVPPPITLDSGAPILFAVDSDPILYSVFTNTSSGPSFAGAKPYLDALIAKADTAAGIATGYTCAEKDLSAYPTYP